MIVVGIVNNIVVYIVVFLTILLTIQNMILSYCHILIALIVIVLYILSLVATEVLGRWEKKRKKEYPGARP
jgi:uncharacterized membrane protein